MWRVGKPPRTVNKRRLCGPLLGRRVQPSNAAPKVRWLWFNISCPGHRYIPGPRFLSRMVFSVWNHTSQPPQTLSWVEGCRHPRCIAAELAPLNTGQEACEPAWQKRQRRSRSRARAAGEGGDRESMAANWTSLQRQRARRSRQDFLLICSMHVRSMTSARFRQPRQGWMIPRRAPTTTTLARPKLSPPSRIS
jgi:hypothetical protein